MTTDAQRRLALRKANAVRSQRSVEKLRLGGEGGRRLAAELLTEVPDYWQSAPLESLLVSVRGIGKSKARKLAASIRCSSHRTIGSLTERQRRELIALVS